MENNVKVQDNTQSLQSCVSVSVTASELRIGNLVHFPFTAENVKVLGINAREYKSEIIHTISFEKGINLYCEKPSVLKPIPLSNEWLERLGFYIVSDNEFKTRFDILKDGRIDFIRVKHELCTSGVRFEGAMLKGIDYVHQLQNFYFIITGSELHIGSITEH